MTAIRTISMTGFASGQGANATHEWSWDIRSVNGKTFDLRLRIPDLAGLEQGLRKAVSAAAARGNISLNLKLSPKSGDEGMRVSDAGLQAALHALGAVRAAAAEHAIQLAPVSAAEVLGLRGVVEFAAPEIADEAALVNDILHSVNPSLTAFAAMRGAEGGEIGAVIKAQMGQIEALIESAETAAAARRPEAEANLRAALARISAETPADPQRVAQELALWAVKADITEELDRLRAHVKAAYALLADDGPVGRKFEFLAQEFVREANTMCSKSGNAALTAIGLELKHVIDQMREQIMNVE